MIDTTLQKLLEKAEAQFPAMMKKAQKKFHQQEFANFDCESLASMTKKELAAWQSKYPMDSPQYIVALQEWNRRLTAEQIKSTRFAAYIGVVSAVLGAIVGASITLLPQFLSSQKVDNNISIERDIGNNNQDHSKQKTKEKETYIKTTVGQ